MKSCTEKKTRTISGSIMGKEKAEKLLHCVQRSFLTKKPGIGAKKGQLYIKTYWGSLQNQLSRLCAHARACAVVFYECQRAYPFLSIRGWEVVKVCTIRGREVEQACKQVVMTWVECHGLPTSVTHHEAGKRRRQVRQVHVSRTNIYSDRPRDAKPRR